MHIGRTNTYTAQRFFDSRKVYHPAFFYSHKTDCYPALTINRSTGAVYVACATHKGKKGKGLLHVSLLVKSRRFCRFCQFKPGFCGFITKNPFKMRYFAIYNSFRDKKAYSAAVRRFQERVKSCFFSYI